MNKNSRILTVLLAVALGGWSCTESGSALPDGAKTPAAAPASGLGRSSEGSGGKRASNSVARQTGADRETKGGKVMKTEEEWKKQLTPEQYYVCRQKGTERAFTGEYWNNKKDGTYVCVACGNELFSSDTKFDSGTGWPSYWAPIDKDNVKTETDGSLGMVRTEALCSRCDSHLGHVFDDGPAPTNLRYCINSVALGFEEKKADSPSDTSSKHP